MDTIIIRGIEDIEEGAKALIEALGERRHVAFVAPMGTGKTTLISAMCRVLGVEDEATSPTFSIVNEYRTASGEAVYHFDFYRLEDVAEVQDLGLDEYFDSDALCLMEWPEIAAPFLPEDTVVVQMEALADGSRQITL